MSRGKRYSQAKSHGASWTVKQRDFESIARAYLRNLQESYQDATATDQATPELSYRPVLNKFLTDVSSLIHADIHSIFEPRKQASSGRPDWRFFNSKTLGLFGYVEAKALDTRTSIKVAAYSKQIKKYLDLGALVVVTDGLDFIFYTPNVGNKRVSLVRKPLTGAADWSKLMPDPRIESQFREFFKDTVSRPTSEESLVKELAKRAVQMSNGVRELAGLREGQGTSEAENTTIGALYELHMVLKEHHDPSLNTAKVFADFIAQVLAFGLLYAHRVVGAEADTPIERREKIVRFWKSSSHDAFTRHLGPFREIIGLLATELESSGPLGTWYQDTLMFLSHVRLQQSQTTTPDYHVLYERFLNAFDPQAKFDFGTYYTPVELSRFTVLLVQTLVSSEMEGRNLYDRGNKLIDPCCGTGTFLEQLLHFAPDDRLPKIIGFEILPAPYTLSHYRLSALRITPTQKSNISIILTNTLSDELEKKVYVESEHNLLSQEQNEARRLARPPLMLVIGNPPSSDSYKHANGDHFEIINSLIDDFRPPSNRRTTRQNTQKQLRNPFVKFLRWTDGKLAHRHPGIFALVLPSSFLAHATYRWAREWLLRNFPKMWILDLDADLRRGIDSSSLFNTQQGRCLIVGMTTDENENQMSKPQLHYATMTALSRTEKLQNLTLIHTPQEILNLFEDFELDESTFKFKLTKPVLIESYKHFWPLYAVERQPTTSERFIFRRLCSGIKLAPPSLFVHVEQGLLLRRSRDIADTTENVETVLARWFSGNPKSPRRTKLTSAVREALKDDLSEGGTPQLYSYRPFLNPYILLGKKAIRSLAAIKNSGTRLRPEVVAAFEDKATIGISVAPAPEDIGDDLHRFVSFCWYYPDNDLCSRGNAKIFCNQFPEYKTQRNTWSPKPLINLNEVLLRKVVEMTGLSDGEAADALVYYVYAVMSSKEYRTELADTLFKTADPDNPPRIPVTQNLEQFNSLVVKGKALAELEKPQQTESDPSPTFSHFLDLFVEAFKLDLPRINAETGEISLFQESELKLKLQGIPPVILDYDVGGYRVVRQWLKLYTHPFLKAEFTKTHFQHLLILLSQIEKQISIIDELGPLVSPLLDGTGHLFSAADVTPVSESVNT